MNEETRKPVCPYCGKDAKLVEGREVYPYRYDLYDKRFWTCAPCDARVGCHNGTDRPLGRLADGALRRAKMAAHAAFDPLWKSGAMRRENAYAWLAVRLGIEDVAKDCHIGEFDVATCERVVAICNEERARRARS